VSFTNPQKKNPEETNLEYEGPRNGSPTLYPIIRKLPVHKGISTMGEISWCTIKLGNYSHRAMTLLSPSDACSNTPHICKSVLLVQVHLVKFESNAGIRYQLSQPQNAIHFLCHE
jgi:hypothetical protein